MKIKFILFITSSAVVVIHASDHGGGHGNGWGSGSRDGHTVYKFEYAVGDPKTKDYKSQYEHRVGDYVVGAYEVEEADGTKRIVKYRAGPDTGFEAVVEKVGNAVHPVSHASGSDHEGDSNFGVHRMFGGFSHGEVGGFGGYKGGYGGHGNGFTGGYDSLKSGYGLGHTDLFGGFGGGYGGLKSSYGMGLLSGYGGPKSDSGSFGGIGGISYVGTSYWGGQGHESYGGLGGHSGFGGYGGLLHKM